MPEQTKTVVIIQSHEQTIIRRSRRVISSQVLTQGAVARPGGAPIAAAAMAGSIGTAPSDATEPLAKRNRRSLVAWWLAVALKGVTAFASWPRRLKRGGNERRNEQP